MNKSILFYKDDSIYLAKENYEKKRSDMKLHSHDYLTVSLLLTGSLIEHTSEATKIVKPGNVLIKPPGVVHENIFTESCSILSLKIFDHKHYNFNWKNWNVLEQSNALKQFLNVLYQKDRKHSLTQLKNNLLLTARKERITKIPTKIVHVKHLIENHFLEVLKITDLAKEVQLNPMYLGQAFKQYYNTDIKSYQQQLRLHFAVSQMCNQDKNLTEIAYKTGFSDQSHFSKSFKKSTKISPKKFTSIINL